MEVKPPLQQPTAHKTSSAAQDEEELDAQIEPARLAQLSPEPNKTPHLPIELVHRILRLGAPVIYAFDELKGAAGRERAAFLSRAALVCSAWREEAQKLLWECVTITSTKKARRFLLSGERGRSSELLLVATRLGTGDRIDADLVCAVLEATQGLEKLSMSSVGDLKVLHLLRNSYPIQRSSSVVPRLSFSLEEFQLGAIWKARDVPCGLLLDVLNSGVKTLTLNLSVQCEEAFRGLPTLERFGHQPLKANQIRSLHPDFNALWFYPFRSLLPLVDNCPRLESLKLSGPHGQLFGSLPQSLRILSLVNPALEELRIVRDMLQEQVRGCRTPLPTLRKLELLQTRKPSQRRQVEITAVREALGPLCATLGVGFLELDIAVQRIRFGAIRA